MAWQAHRARERDEAQRRLLRMARIEAALPNVTPAKQAELRAELERLRAEHLSQAV